MLKIIEILVLVASLTAQDIPVPVIDLTSVVVRHRLREPTTGSGSGDTVGYEGHVDPPPPLTLELISAKRSQPDETSTLICEVELRNVSQKDLDIPVDPSSRDMESASPRIPYQYLKAFIWLAAEPGAKETMPTRGLFLYGSRGVPNSLRTLKPGQAVGIRAKIPIGSVFQNEPGRDVTQPKAIRAFLWLFTESVALQTDGHFNASSKEIFSGVSSSTTVEVPL